ncbi:hypothetical protein [Deinococcus roseus]|uniref:Uncharacterized protein n=1 Tax=Deinococcus roseus TaxID=392414 RepID=A0ABQ2DAM3_9DEIO|nr:hypothetical protein [Deinococcus roseus]GGJ51517.1 hypothetical protein GCM10008938_41870 [Deinococcus roseus]
MHKGIVSRICFVLFFAAAVVARAQPLEMPGGFQYLVKNHQLYLWDRINAEAYQYHPKKQTVEVISHRDWDLAHSGGKHFFEMTAQGSNTLVMQKNAAGQVLNSWTLLNLPCNRLSRKLVCWNGRQGKIYDLDHNMAAVSLTGNFEHVTRVFENLDGATFTTLSDSGACPGCDGRSTHDLNTGKLLAAYRHEEVYLQGNHFVLTSQRAASGIQDGMLQEDDLDDLNQILELKVLDRKTGRILSEDHFAAQPYDRCREKHPVYQFRDLGQSWMVEVTDHLCPEVHFIATFQKNATRYTLEQIHADAVAKHLDTHPLNLGPVVIHRFPLSRQEWMTLYGKTPLEAAYLIQHPDANVKQLGQQCLAYSGPQASGLIHQGKIKVLFSGQGKSVLDRADGFLIFRGEQFRAYEVNPATCQTL